MTRVPSLGNGVSVPITATEIPALLETLRAEHITAPEPDMLIDWMGVRTRIPMLPWAPGDLAGTVSTALPIPDDGYRSEDVEYAALARALRELSDHPVRRGRRRLAPRHGSVLSQQCREPQIEH